MPGMPEVDGCDAGKPLGLFPLLLEEGEGEVEPFCFSEPALVCGSAAADLEVVLDFREAGQHLRTSCDAL
jgi:hypothetical protein